jgi:integrase
MRVGTGLRPEELFALERRDHDLDGGVVSVERAYAQGVLTDCRKSCGSVAAFRFGSASSRRSSHSPRIDTPLLFPAARGGYIDSEKLRYRHWTPALRAAGVEHRRV